uniref:DDE-1 domain-containing protein n=1 Tax=Oryzias sinensis TaxID=183150 RepID=A0A8C7YX60_9TELE
LLGIKVLTLHEKIELFDKLKDGKSYAAVGRYYGLNEIGSSVAPAFCRSAKMVNVVRDKTIVRMESALAFWIQDLWKKNIPLDINSTLPNTKCKFPRRSLDTDAAAYYPETFKQLIMENVYKPEQVFNMDETALFWKKMPSRTFLMEDEMKAPGFKAQKDRFTLMCGNAAGRMMKPGLIYKSANPRALKSQNTLPVFWMHNSKAWITKVLTSNWFYQSFIPQAREYLHEKGMAFQVLLLKDNTGDHAVDLHHEGVRIEFLPPNTTSLLQPMDQGQLSSTLKVYWRNFTIASSLTVIHKLIGGDGFDDVTHEEFNELVDAHSQPLTDQDLAELMQSASENGTEDQEDPSQEDEGLILERLADLMQAAKQLQEIVKSWDPYMVRAVQFANAIDSAMSMYKTLFTSMKKQRASCR